MGIFSQCMDIINLVSLDWKEERFVIVAHSFRVMAKARNFDEIVFGMMLEDKLDVLQNPSPSSFGLGAKQPRSLR